MAQTFHANAGTRLHPVEWSSGLAAGASAALMARLHINTRQVYDDHLETLQLEILQQGGKLEWTLEDAALGHAHRGYERERMRRSLRKEKLMKDQA